MMPLLRRVQLVDAAAPQGSASSARSCSFTSNRKRANAARPDWPKKKRSGPRSAISGNEARLQEDVRSDLDVAAARRASQDLRFAFRTLFKHRAVAVFAIVSLALGIGANTAIYSFMDAILLRSLPVGDPSSLVVMTWRSKQVTRPKPGDPSAFVMHSGDGSTFATSTGQEARIFPLPAFERLRDVAAPVLSTIFVRFPAGTLTVQVDGESELTNAEFVSGDFFRGIALSPGAGRLLLPEDDRASAPPVAVIHAGYAERRFGSLASAVGRSILVNNLPFTVVGVTAAEFDGIEPGITAGLYLPLQTNRALDRVDAQRLTDPNWYWAEIMGRLRDGVTREQAEQALSAPFAQWAASTASNDIERANLPVLRVEDGGGGLDTLRRKYTKPLYLLLAMVGLILAIACANTANLLLARATARQREIAVRLSIGAGRFRLIRQLLTESLVLSVISGALGVLIAIAGTRVLTLLLANSEDGLTLDAGLNWRVLAVTIALSVAMRSAVRTCAGHSNDASSAGAGAEGNEPAPPLSSSSTARRRADRAADVVARRRGPVRAHAVEPAIDSAWIQSRQSVARRIERATSRVSGSERGRLLRDLAAACIGDSRRPRRHARALVAAQGRPWTSGFNRGRGGRRHAVHADRATILLHDADSDRAGPRDRRA